MNLNSIKTPKYITIISFLVCQILLYLIDATIYVQFAFGLLFIYALTIKGRKGKIFIFRVLTPIVVGVVFTAVYHYAYGINGIKYILDASFRVSFLLDKFFNVISTLYAITIAFLMWKGLSDYDYLKALLYLTNPSENPIIGSTR